MELDQCLAPERVLMLKDKSKDDVLQALARVLADTGGVGPYDELLAAIRHREQLMSTGIGQGIAIPHVRLEAVERPVMAVGVRPAGIDGYESLDDQPVTIVVMIAAPKGQHEQYIKLLSTVTRVLKSDQRRHQVVTAGTPEEVFRLLQAPPK